MSVAARGKCLCGKIEMELYGKPGLSVVCYCSDCRKNSGFFCQFVSVYKKERVAIHDPENHMKVFTVTGTQSGKPKPKFFCGNCGCTLLTAPEAHEGMYCVRTSILDEGYQGLRADKTLFAENKTEQAVAASKL